MATVALPKLHRPNTLVEQGIRTVMADGCGRTGPQLLLELIKLGKYGTLSHIHNPDEYFQKYVDCIPALLVRGIDNPREPKMEGDTPDSKYFYLKGMAPTRDITV